MHAKHSDFLCNDTIYHDCWKSVIYDQSTPHYCCWGLKAKTTCCICCSCKKYGVMDLPLVDFP